MILHACPLTAILHDPCLTLSSYHPLREAQNTESGGRTESSETLAAMQPEQQGERQVLEDLNLTLHGQHVACGPPVRQLCLIQFQYMLFNFFLMLLWQYTFYSETITGNNNL